MAAQFLREIGEVVFIGGNFVAGEGDAEVTHSSSEKFPRERG